MLALLKEESMAIIKKRGAAACRFAESETCINDLCKADLYVVLEMAAPSFSPLALLKYASQL